MGDAPALEHKALVDGYDGGSTQRRQLSTFNPLGASPDAAFLPRANTIRARSRELARNSAIGLGAINTAVTSVVGTGLELHSRIDYAYLGIEKDTADDWQKKAERIFRNWSLYEADVSRQSTFYALQEIAFRSVLEGGDAFAVLVQSPRKDTVLSTRVQLVEAELVCNPNGTRDTPDLTAGVELDAQRVPVAYHVANQYPGFNQVPKAKKWTRVPAFGSRTGRRNVLHLMRIMRPGQTRGISFLAPVIEPIKQLKDYTEAEITASVISGMFSIFIKTPGGNGFEPLNPQNATTATSSAGDSIELAPGLVASLAEGEEPVAFNPGRPNTAFDGFVMSILRQIGVALEIPYELLIKQFVSSFSAARGALGEAWRFFRARREWLVAVFCQPCYEAVIDEAVAMGLLDAPGYFDDIQIRRAYLGTEWTGDGQTVLNPVQEATAAEARVRLGISNRAIECSELTGRDWGTEKNSVSLTDSCLHQMPAEPSSPQWRLPTWKTLTRREMMTTQRTLTRAKNPRRIRKNEPP
jgi:lambda family phage portal protein